MSYEKAKILGVEQRVNKDSGELFHRVSFEMVVRASFNLKGDAMALEPHFSLLKGKTALVPLRSGSFEDGRTFWMLGTDGDGMPIPVPESAPVVSLLSDEKSADSSPAAPGVQFPKAMGGK